MKRKLTLKQTKFIKEYIKTGNGTQSALKVYDTKDPEVAQVIASENLSKPMVNDEVQQSLRRSGLDLDHISDELASIGFKQAERPLSYNEKLKALELALKISGKLDRRSQSVTVSLSARLEALPFSELKSNLANSSDSTSRLLQDLE